MFQKDNPDILWVKPRENAVGVGTYDDPFYSIPSAIERVTPGQVIVLRSGEYSGDVTVQKSGSSQHPITITTDENAKVTMIGSCWYFYDVSDIVISRLNFQDSPFGAIAMIGKCERNRIEFTRFINCGTDKKTACTVFFGGSEAYCNIVEGCHFELSSELNKEDLQNSVGLMISEGDFQEGVANRDHVFRKNTFKNYGYGILIGSHDDTTGEYGHVVEYNVVENCINDGILAKCGDTQIRGNRVTNCRRNSISVVAGKGSIVEDNRVENSCTGIQVKGLGHTIQNNCIVKCSDQAINIPGNSREDKVPSKNIFIEKNTCIDCGIKNGKKGVAGIRIHQDALCVVRQNLFHGSGKPYYLEPNDKSQSTQCLIDENVSSGDCKPMNGSTKTNVTFLSYSNMNFENSSGFGASGPVLQPNLYDPDTEPNSASSIAEPTALEQDDSPADALIDEVNEKELYARSFLFKKKGKKEQS